MEMLKQVSLSQMMMKLEKCGITGNVSRTIKIFDLALDKRVYPSNAYPQC